MTSLHGVLDDAGLVGFVHAVDIDSGAELGLGADEPVVPASVFKVPILVELCRQWSAGELSPSQRVFLPAGEQLTLGATGTSIARDDVELSLYDLAVSMIAVSDNRATDVVIAHVGLDRINATLRELGHHGTVLVGDCNFLFATMAEDLGCKVADFGSIHPVAFAEALLSARVSRPAETTRTTPRETTRLLTQLWTDAILDVGACAHARRILATQVLSQRIGSGFPEADVTISGKTGTIGPWRTEAAVVETGDARRFAVAVFVTGVAAGARHPVADATIGRLARLAVNQLR